MESMQIADLITEIAQKISAPSDLLPTFGYNKDFAYPEIRVDDEGYHYIVIERGEEFEHFVTRDIKELLYIVFQQVTSSMAFDYEVKNRIEYQDFRRIAFEKQIELLLTIDTEFATKRKTEIKAILKDHPFDDLALGIPRLYAKIKNLLRQWMKWP